jgi:GWxTD domain-containing protein
VLGSRSERKAFVEAASRGRPELERYLEAFWARYDPTPGTRTNEFRLRFEGRVARMSVSFCPPGCERPDERLVAYALWGTPSGVYHPADDPARLIWEYQPDIYAMNTGLRHPDIGWIETRIIFTVDKQGYHWIDWDARDDEFRTLLRPVPRTQLVILSDIVMDRGSEPSLRRAAIWRLRADPGVESFTVLLRAAASGDSVVAEATAACLEPLVPSGRDEQGNLTYQIGPVTRPARVLTPAAPTPAGETRSGISMPAFVRAGPAESREALETTIYDPSTRLPTGYADSLRTLIDPNTRTDRDWLDPMDVAGRYSGPLEEARRLLDEGEPLAAHARIDPVRNHELAGEAEAWHLDALALSASGEPGGRRLAEERIRQAIRMDPGNVRYLLSLAYILHLRTLDYYADDQLDAILETRPGTAQAYAVKGKIRMDAFWGLEWRVSPWASKSLEERLIPLEEQHARFLQQLDTALVLDPANHLANWCLAQHFLICRDWRRLVAVSNHMIEQGRYIPEAWLARGLAFQYLGLLDAAGESYERGLALLPLDIRAMAQLTEWTLPPSRGGVSPAVPTRGIPARDVRALVAGGVGADTVLAQASERSWRSRDPLFATGLNERRLEQYRRFAYATWRFANVTLGLRGWETQRGLVYMRYGEPLNAPSPEEPTDQTPTWATVDHVRKFNRSSGWVYDGFTVPFRIGQVTGNFTLADPRTYTTLAEERPESSDVVGGRHILAVPTEWLHFETEAGESIHVPLVGRPSAWGAVRSSEPPVAHDISLDLIGLSTHLFLLDEDWHIIDRSDWGVPVAFYSGEVDPWVGPALTAPSTPDSHRGTYAGIEIIPSAYPLAWTSHDTLESPTDGRLRLSSLVLASAVEPAAAGAGLVPEGILVREPFRIVPLPPGSIAGEMPLFLYFEVYGLKKDEVGGTQYEVAVMVATEPADRSGVPLIESLWGRLTGRTQQEGAVTLTFERSGIAEREQESLRVVLPTPRPGSAHRSTYRLRLEVTDKISGARAQVARVLTVDQRTGR